LATARFGVSKKAVRSSPGGFFVSGRENCSIYKELLVKKYFENILPALIPVYSQGNSGQFWTVPVIERQ